jgi:hypothetical protein
MLEGVSIKTARTLWRSSFSEITGLVSRFPEARLEVVKDVQSRRCIHSATAKLLPARVTRWPTTMALCRPCINECLGAWHVVLRSACYKNPILGSEFSGRRLACLAYRL